MIPRFAIVYNNAAGLTPDQLKQCRMTPAGTVFYEGGGDKDELVEIRLRVSRDFLKAPSFGVQATIVENPYSCRYVWRGQDHYFMLSSDDCEIHAADNLTPFLIRTLKGLVKFGECVGTNEWERVYQDIKQYQGIPTQCDRRPRPDEDDPTPMD